MEPQHPTRTATGPRPRARVALVAVLALALAAVAGGLAAGEEGPDPIEVEILTERATFTDDVAIQIRNKFDGHGTDVLNMRDASNIVVARITIQPGATFPWHTHPGPVLINIAEGDEDRAFDYVLADDCVEREYARGEALVDAGGDNVHTAHNPSGSETVVIATFLDAPDEGALTVFVDNEQMDSLDGKCGLETPRP